MSASTKRPPAFETRRPLPKYRGQRLVRDGGKDICPGHDVEGLVLIRQSKTIPDLKLASGRKVGDLRDGPRQHISADIDPNVQPGWIRGDDFAKQAARPNTHLENPFSG